MLETPGVSQSGLYDGLLAAGDIDLSSGYTVLCHFCFK